MSRFLIFVDGRIEEEFETFAAAEDAAEKWVDEIRGDAISNGGWDDERVRIVEVLRDWQVHNVTLADNGADCWDLCDVAEGGGEIDRLRKELDVACSVIHDLQLDHTLAVASERERIRGWLADRPLISSVRAATELDAGKLLPPDVLREQMARMREALVKMHEHAMRHSHTAEAEMIAEALYS